MASSWRYPHHLHKHQDSRCMTSFRLPMPNLPPLRSPPSTSCPLASLPAKSRRWHKGRPRVRHRECRPCELASKESDSSSNSVSLPQMKVSRADEEGRTRRHNSKGDYCKVSDNECTHSRTHNIHACTVHAWAKLKASPACVHYALLTHCMAT